MQQGDSAAHYSVREARAAQSEQSATRKFRFTLFLDSGMVEEKPKEREYQSGQSHQDRTRLPRVTNNRSGAPIIPESKTIRGTNQLVKCTFDRLS
jgi:hypothetical protein